MKKILTLTLCLALLLGLFSGCGGKRYDPLAGVETTVFTDDAGRDVTVPADITRIAASGSTAQMILMTLVPELLVGLASSPSTAQRPYFPAEMWTLPTLGQFYGSKSNLNMEALIDAEPQLIVDLGDAKENVRSKFDRRRTRYSIDRVVSADMPWEELCEIMHSYTTVVLMPMKKELRRRIMDDCFWHGIAIMLKPDMQDIMVNCADTVIMSDVPLCAVHTGNHDRGYLTAKRVLDIVASVCGLIICSPIFLAVAIAIKIQDGGPVFYRQKRLTLNGKPFYLTKFRSMVVNAESATGAVLAGKSDSRITKVGAFLRATRIDELPQLLNILNGDMTLVGPRPERPEFYQKYCAEYPEFAYRLRAKAGLTGYAQLYGKYNTTFADKALLDMYYIQKASFLWDLQLIFYTLKIIFVKESTEGVETKPAEPEKKEPACAGETK